MIDPQTFSDLLRLDPSQSPGNEQKLAVRLFPTLVQGAGMHLYGPNDSIESNGRRLLIGVATFSPNDMLLLDRVCSSVKNMNAKSNIRVDVFNIAEVPTIEALRAYFPGVDSLPRSIPYAGLWVDGELKEFGAAGEARLIVERALSIGGAP